MIKSKKSKINIKWIILIIIGIIVLIGLLYYLNIIIIHKDKFGNKLKENNIYQNKYKFILIIGTGRSGSTLLQRIINTIPNTNICGENYGALFNLLQFYYNLKLTKEKSIKEQKFTKSYDKLISLKIKPSWYNYFNIDIIKNKIKNIIIDMFYKKDCKIIGCKTIRFNKNNLFLMDLFLELFPNTKIICHYRENINDQSKSSWWSNYIKKSKIKLKNLNNLLINYSKKNSSSYIFTFNKIFNIDEIKNLFRFLEEDLDENKYKEQIQLKL